jgi:hypothetical protein
MAMQGHGVTHPLFDIVDAIDTEREREREREGGSYYRVGMVGMCSRALKNLVRIIII